MEGQRGQASLLLLGMIAALLVGTLVLFGFGQALGARSKHQRAADLAAVSAAQVMSRHYQRLFEPAVFENALPNPRHLSNETYLGLARAATLRGARRNGVPASGVEVDFPAAGFAPTQIEVRTTGEARVRLGEGRTGERIPVRASAIAEIAPDLNVAFGMPSHGSGGGYDGPLAYRMGKPMRPDVAAAFDRMAAAARSEAGLSLSVSSGFRSDAEQAVLWNANPNPHLFPLCRAAPVGRKALIPASSAPSVRAAGAALARVNADGACDDRSTGLVLRQAVTIGHRCHDYES